MTQKRHPGSSYHKVDLHVHTPQSKDYRDKSVQPEDIVKAALEAELDAIAITDHNDYRYIDKVKLAADGTHLVVFPGVEISTRDGHLLAILDPSKSGDDVRTLLIACGLSKVVEYGEQETLCSLAFEDAAKRVRDNGGIAIAAHFDGPKGFTTTVGVGQARKRIFESSWIEAVELINASDKSKWVEGKVWGKSRACVQGSDAHNLQEIGQRATWLRVAKLDLSGLRLAFGDPKVRIRFPEEYGELKPRSYIESLEVSQGFFQGVKVQFNPGLNCLVGGQGTGKSALIEFIRFGLKNTSGVPEIEKDHNGKLQQLLGLGGSVSITICTSDGLRLIVTRTYDGNENPSRVVEVIDNGALEPYSLGDISRSFPVLAYSQSEGMSIARDSIRQLELIDNHVDLSKDKATLGEYMRTLRENTGQLKQIEANLYDIPDMEKQKEILTAKIIELTKKLEEIDAVNKEPALRSHQHWNAEKLYLDAVQAGLKKLMEDTVAKIHAIEFHEIERSAPSSQIGNEEELKTIREIVLRGKQHVQSLEKQIQEELEGILMMLTDSEAYKSWQSRHEQHKAEYEDVSERLANASVNDLQNRLQSAKNDLHKVETLLDRALSHERKKQDLCALREKLLDQIERELRVISTKRDRHATTMSNALRGRIQISIKSMKNRQSLKDWLETNARSKQFNARHIQTIVENDFSPRKLAKLIREKDAEAIANCTGLSRTSVDAFLALFLQDPSLVYELEEVLLEDLPDIRMKRSDDEYKEFDALSTGQKFTVIILLALTDDDKPIVYDQPEDALDTALIYSDIAQILRKSKDHRQFIFATHNSNMSVSADLDLAIILEGTATSSQVSHAGGLEQVEVKDLLVQYLEGGTEAMQQRVSKYGYQPR